MKTFQAYKTFFAIVILMSITVFSNAQKSGVFKSFTDYSKGKMEYGIDCTTEKHKIRLNDFLGKDYITVIHDGKSYNLKKSETWGFLLCNEKLVRFQDSEHFPIVDRGSLWIYSKQSVQVGSPKTGGSKTVTTNYFSKDGNSVIKELTLLNLKAAFPDNHMLHDAIDRQFKTDASLGEYDKFHKHYSINHFLESQGTK
ncbi:MAG: hypothetical protein GZ094_20400 [Mariniphaga sp.]|nr:hypothetical protein [Mariniphaga sp.]